MARRLAAFVTSGATMISAIALPLWLGSSSPALAQNGNQTATDAAVTVHATPVSPAGLAGSMRIAGSLDSQDAPDVATLTVQRGDTLQDLLVNAGVTVNDAHGAIHALSRYYDPKRLQIGQVVTAVMQPATGDGTARLAAVSLAIGDADYVVASRTSDGSFLAKHTSQPPDAALQAPVEAPPPAAGSTADVRNYEVRRGDTLMRIAVNAGARRAEADQAIHQLARLYNPQALQIGQKLQIALSPDAKATLLSISLDLGHGSYAVVERTDSGAYRAYKDSHPAVATSSGSGAAGNAKLASALDQLGAHGAKVQRLTISRGDTLSGLMVDAGATLTEASEAAHALARRFDPRRLQIGQTLYVAKTPGPAGSGLRVLGLVVLDAGKDGVIVVSRRSDGSGYDARHLNSAGDLAALTSLIGKTAAPASTTADGGQATNFDHKTRVETLNARKGDTLVSLLRRAGGSRGNAEQVVAALRRLYDPRRLQIGQEVRVALETTASGEKLVSVSLKLKDNLFIQADLQGSRYSADRTTAPLNPAFSQAGGDSAAADATSATSDQTPVASLETDTVPAAPSPPLAAPVNTLESKVKLSAKAEQVWLQVEKGDTLPGLLRGLGVSTLEVHKLILALGKTYDLGSLQVGQQIVAITDQDDAGVHVIALSIPLSDHETLALVRQVTGGYHIRQASRNVDLSDFQIVDGKAAQPSGTVSDAPAQAAMRSVTIHAGSTLMKALLGAGIKSGQAAEAIVALRHVFNPRNIRAGQKIQVSSAGGDLNGLILSTAPGERVEVARTSGGSYVARQVALPLHRKVMVAHGVIVSSLYKAAADAGMPIAVMADLIRAFSFDVDFQREIHSGDRFQVMYEEFTNSDGKVVRYGSPLFAELDLSGVKLAIYRYTPKGGFTDYFNDKGQSVRKALLRTPIDGARITSGFGMRFDPVLGYTHMHEGVDFGAPTGTPILAAGNGVIEIIGWVKGYGRYIRIRHNSVYQTAYAHMSKFAAGLRVGSHVRQGQVIGYVGQTGWATGPHLHYEVLVHNKQINPMDVKLPSGQMLAGAQLQDFYRQRDALDAQYAELRHQQILVSER